MEGQSSRRRIWITIGLIALIIFLLVYFVDWDDVLRILSLTDWGIMLVGGIVLLVGIIFISWRWRFVLADKPKYFETFHTDSIGYMVTLLSPIPGPAMRVVALTQSTEVSVSQATPAMIVDTMLGTVMRLIALILALVLQSPIDSILGTVLIGSVLILLILGIIIWIGRNPEKFIPRLGNLLQKLPGMRGDRLQRALDDLQVGLSGINSIKNILTALLLSFIMWSCFWAFHYLGFRALPIVLSSRDMLTLAAAALVVVPPSAPAMIGVYQGAMVAFLLLFRISDANALTAYAILVFAVLLILWLILGSWGLFRSQLKLRELILLTREVVQGDERAEG